MSSVTSVNQIAQSSNISIPRIQLEMSFRRMTVLETKDLFEQFQPWAPGYKNFRDAVIKTPITFLKLKELKGNRPLQMEQTDRNTINHWAGVLRKHQKVPPIIVQKKKGKWFVLDGRHRLAAYRALHFEVIPSLVWNLH